MVTPYDEFYIKDFLRTDTSFRNSGFAGFFSRYKQSDLRDAHEIAVRIGFDLGIERGSPDRRIIELGTKVRHEKDKEFYTKFIKLCTDYNVRIKFHPMKGMVFEDLV